jgi:hypothetical protein
MCNACGYYCCASDEFDHCGCEYCYNPACWPPFCESCGEYHFEGKCDTEDEYEEE